TCSATSRRGATRNRRGPHGARSCRSDIRCASSTRAQALREEVGDAIEGDALLSSRIAVAHGHSLARDRFPVHREAVRTACLVHARVALADRLFDVVLDRTQAAKATRELGVEPLA